MDGRPAPSDNPQSRGETRRVVALIHGVPTSDGAGVKLTRVIGGRTLPDLDPFLMLDEFGSERGADYIGGFPDHPHRGFETVTYMLDGRMRHGDNKGHSGLLVPGSVQWMTAGRGIVHSEMPEQEDGLMRGFQLWVNLPAREKLCEPRYQEFTPDKIPTVHPAPNVAVKVIAGTVRDVRGSDTTGDTTGPVGGVATDPTYLDISLAPNAKFAHALPRGHNAFAYVFEGAAIVGGKDVAKSQLAVLGPGDTVEVAAGEIAARLILVAGQPLREPVAKYGPFVMNTDEEIHQAIADYQMGRL